jgi:adenylate cyclase
MTVERTFSFLDQCVFTAFTERHGDADAVAVLAHLRRVIRMPLKPAGVGSRSGSATSRCCSGVDGTAVLPCSQGIHDEVQRDGSLALRRGLSSGEIIMFEGDDYISVAFNLAARLCRAARPGELLIGQELRPSVREGLQATTAGDGNPRDGEARHATHDRARHRVAGGGRR